MGFRLGLAVGTNSIGWAALTLEAGLSPSGILDMGVRVFSDGRDPKDGSSLAFKRRIQRGQRRRRDRYLDRRSELVDTLVACGLMPPDSDARRTVAQLDPYALRARALDHKLTPYELGRALFHLNQGRGFKSNRQVEQHDGSETGVTKQATQALEGRMAELDLRTLGEFLDQQRRRGRPTRFRNLATGAAARYEFYPTRQMVEDEFDLIRAVQAPHQGLDPNQWDTLRDIVFHQRPLRPVDPGRCLLEPAEPRAARALPVAQEFRMLQEVNSLRLRVGIEPERPLNADERALALQRLRSGKDINLRRPTHDLGLPPGAAINLPRGGTAVRGDEAAAGLMRKKENGRRQLEIFGARWLGLSLERRDEIVRRLLETEDPEAVRRMALDEWGLGEAAASAVAAASMPGGFLYVSEKAIRKLLPHLEAGLAYSEAVVMAKYPQHSDNRSTKAHAQLPYYGVVLARDVVGADATKDPHTAGEPARYGRFPNPTVHIGLNQLRRVVNRIIDVYGKPEDIVVELARDLKANRRQKRRHRQQQRANEARNQRFKRLLQSAGIPDTPHTLRKLRLWEEQGPDELRVCPYSGSPISFAMAASSQSTIDHILPFSRTLNDSMANKVVCLTGAKLDKGNQSPFEAFGHNPPGYDYDAMRSRAAALPANKRWRFDPGAMQRFDDRSEFLNRQLNETRYLARTVRAYLANLYDEESDNRRRVRVIPGLMTSLLRRSWELEGMWRAAGTDEVLRKQRDDHRHHAIDAFVVACTTPGFLQQLAIAAPRFDAAERLAAVVPPPWNGFDRSEVRQALDRLVVSHKPDHGTHGLRGNTTGQLHNETAYGLVELASDEPSRVVIRKPLSTLNLPKDLEFVRDPALRGALKDLWSLVEASGGSAAEFADRATSAGVRLSGRRVHVRRVRILDEQRVLPIRDAAGRPYKGYTPGGNAFVDVWRMRDGSWKLAVVPRFNFNQPDFDIEAFRPADKESGAPDPVAKRLMRLHIDDMGALGEGVERRIVRVRKASRDRIWLDDHNEANAASRIRKRELKEHKYSARQLQRLGFRKVGVDEIGRVRDPGPRNESPDQRTLS